MSHNEFRFAFLPLPLSRVASAKIGELIVDSEQDGHLYVKKDDGTVVSKTKEIETSLTEYATLIASKNGASNVGIEIPNYLSTNVKNLMTEMDTKFNDENVTQKEGQITLSDSSRIVSIADGRIGIPNVTLGGSTLYNGVYNGDFSGGTAGWGAGGATNIVTDKILSNTGNGATPSPSLNKLMTLTGFPGEKIFVRARLKVPVGCTKIQLAIYNGTSTKYAVNIIPTVFGRYVEYSGITTLTETGSSNLYVAIYHSYVDAATSNGKIMEVDGNAGVFAIPLTDTPYENYTAEQINSMINAYFYGPKSVAKTSLINTGINMFDGEVEAGMYSTDTGLPVASADYTRSKNKIYVNPSTNYYFSSAMGTTHKILAYTADDTFVGTYSTQAFTTGANVRYIRVYTSLTYSASNDVKYQINEGTTALTYEKYVSKFMVVECTDSTKLLLRRVSSVQDTVNITNGAVSVTKRNNLYKLVDADITFIDTSLTNVDLVRISKRSDAKDYTLDGTMVTIPSLSKVLSANKDAVASISRYFVGADNNIWYITAKGSTLAQAKTALIGKEIFYQLATPITIPESDFYMYGITVTGRNDMFVNTNIFNLLSSDVTPSVTLTYPKSTVSSLSSINKSVIELLGNNNKNTSLLVYKGDYSSTVAYKVNDIVKLDKTRYICLKDAQGIDPSTSEEYFEPFSSSTDTLVKRLSDHGSITVATNTITITHVDYIPDVDEFDLYVNGRKLTEGEDFTRVSRTITKKNTDGFSTWQANTFYDVIITKNVVSSNVKLLDATELMDKSINTNKIMDVAIEEFAKWKGAVRYNSIEELGLVSATATLDEIWSAMVANSQLNCKVDGNPNMPSSGNYQLICEKHIGDDSMYVKAVDRTTSSGFLAYEGNYNVLAIPKFTGWKDIPVADGTVQQNLNAEKWDGWSVFSNVIELGLNEATCTYADICDAMPAKSRLHCPAPNSNFTIDGNTWERFVITVVKNTSVASELRLAQIYDFTNDMPMAVYDAYYYHSGETIRWSNWQRVWNSGNEYLLVKNSSSDKIYYVDGTAGSDSNDGLTVGTAFKTITKAISVASDAKFIRHATRIRVMAGDYISEGHLTVTGLVGDGFFFITAFDGTNEVSNYTLSSNYKVLSLKYKDCNCNCYGQGLYSTTNSNNGFMAEASKQVLFTSCVTDVVSNYAGFRYSSNSSGRVYSCIASNKLQALVADMNCQVMSREWGTSVGNTYGLYSDGATIYKYGAQPQGTTNEGIIHGGQILGDYLQHVSIADNYKIKAFGVAMMSPAGQNELEVDLGAGYFSGTLKITLASGYNTGNAAGSIEKTIDILSSTGSASITVQKSMYTHLSDYTKLYFMISDVYIKNGRKTIKIIQNTSSKNSIYVTIQAFGYFVGIENLAVGSCVSSVETFVVPSMVVTPTESLISTGFATNWSGSISCRTNQENEKKLVLALASTVDVPTTGITVYSLAVSQRPIASVFTLIPGTTSAGGVILNSFIMVVISASTGAVTLYSVGSVTANVRGAYATLPGYY